MMTTTETLKFSKQFLKKKIKKMVKKRLAIFDVEVTFFIIKVNALKTTFRPFNRDFQVER